MKAIGAISGRSLADRLVVLLDRFVGLSAACAEKDARRERAREDGEHDRHADAGTREKDEAEIRLHDAGIVRRA